MKFELDLQVLRHSDVAVEGARAEERDGMAINWEARRISVPCRKWMNCWKHLGGICLSFHKSLCWLPNLVTKRLYLVSIS